MSFGVNEIIATLATEINHLLTDHENCEMQPTQYKRGAVYPDNFIELSASQLIDKQ